MTKIDDLMKIYSEEYNKKWDAIKAMMDANIKLSEACVSWSDVQRKESTISENELNNKFRESIAEIFTGINGLVISGIISQDILDAAWAEQGLPFDQEVR